MRAFIYIAILLLPSAVFSQSLSGKFKKLSRPEKRWVYFHPFVAKRAFIETKQVQSVVDSLKRSGTIGTDLNGGRLDAFKHAYWMLSLTKEIGKRRALKLGIAHEKGNYLEFKKHQLEDNILPDSVSSAMDLKNNAVGANVFMHLETTTPRELQRIILETLATGLLYIIKKDQQGNYVSCDGRPLDMVQWKGKWGIPKCLVSSTDSEQ